MKTLILPNQWGTGKKSVTHTQSRNREESVVPKYTRNLQPEIERTAPADIFQFQLNSCKADLVFAVVCTYKTGNGEFSHHSLWG